MTMPEMVIPLAEFEHLHAEVRRLRDGWSRAEAHIAVLDRRARELQNYADRHPCDHWPQCRDAQEP